MTIDPEEHETKDGLPDRSGERGDRVTDLLRGIIAREARAAGGGQLGSHVRYVGDYELVEEIAAGGMGVVFRAHQVSLDREVALKMILTGALANDEAVERFRHEAKAAAQLQHPGIVSVFEVGEHVGQQYFSMELVEGESLADLVARGPLPGREAAELMQKVAAAVDYAHKEGVLHRDIKPSNILITRDGEPRVTDFGLARRLDGSDRRTLTGTVVGTPSYMSPEQATGERSRVGAASDVYSVGAVLYELLTGRPPFQADTPLRTLQQVVGHEPPVPSLLNPAVPADLEVICMKCLRKNPGARYGSAGQLADDLRRFLERRPIRARPSGAMARTWTWLRRNPWTLLALASGITVTLAGVAYWLWVERSYWRGVAEHGGVLGSDVPGRLSDAARSGTGTVFLILLLAFQYVSSERSSFRRLRSRRWLLALLAGAGALGIAVAMLQARALIDTYVWRSEWSPVSWAQVYGLAYLGAFVVSRTLHAQEVQSSGVAGELTEEQEDELLDLLENGPKAGFRTRLALAKERYIEWTGADPYHARGALHRMWDHLHSVRPECVPRRRSVLPLVILLFLVSWMFYFSHHG